MKLRSLTEARDRLESQGVAVSATTIWRWVDNGDVEATRLGGKTNSRVFFDAAQMRALTRWAKHGRRPAGRPRKART